jgi:hypothetical protein
LTSRRAALTSTTEAQAFATRRSRTRPDPSSPDIVSVEGAIATGMSFAHLICSDAKAPIPAPHDFDREQLRRAKPLLNGWIDLAKRRSTQEFLAQRRR